jgi:DNA-binding SARP family transcriptional activator
LSLNAQSLSPKAKTRNRLRSRFPDFPVRRMGTHLRARHILGPPPRSGAVVLPLRRLQIRLLGSLAVSGSDGVEFELPSAPLVRAVLETLTLRAGVVVQRWELIDSVWGADSPATVRKSLQTYISGLRQALGPETIETVSGGYRLRLEPADIDINQFERHIGEGLDRLKVGDLPSAVASLSTALALWRGEPLEELVDSPAGLVVRARLWELRRMAEERLYEARLGLGEHDAVVADLQAAVRAEPFRERRWALLMLALYRSGRQGDALAAFVRLETLLGQHHLRPGDDLRALNSAISARDPGLAWRAQLAQTDGRAGGGRAFQVEPGIASVGVGSGRSGGCGRVRGPSTDTLPALYQAEGCCMAESSTGPKGDGVVSEHLEGAVLSARQKG